MSPGQPAPGGEVVRHLYLHVPFCPSICPYCDFHVLTRTQGSVEAYLSRLDAELRELGERYEVSLDTVYLGGGTPSFLRDHELAALVGSVRRHLGWGAQENTLEVNPGTLGPGRAALWRSLGFDRASVGVQSLDDATLKFLGRRHSAAQARAAVSELVAGGWRVSGDLMTAVAGQPLEADVRGLAELGVGHISAYTLTIESGTEFARRGVTVREEDEERGFTQAAELLGELGFGRYEISNYARPGEHSRHNLAYWEGRPYLGAGPSAAGHYPAWPLPPGLGPTKGEEEAPPPGEVLTWRWTNPPLGPWLAGVRPEPEPIDPAEYVTDALFMGLRLRGGLDLADLARRSGLRVEERYAAPLARHLAAGRLTLEGSRLRATEAGWWALNRVVSDFLAVDAEQS